MQSGELRAMTSNDREAVGALLNDIFRTRSHVFDQHVFNDFPLVFTPANFAYCRVISIDNRIVSHAALFPCSLVIHQQHYKTAIIVLVATHTDYRHQGHAARLMRDLQQTMADEAFDLGVLWTGVPRFYEQLGWQVVTTQGLMIADLMAEPLDRIAALAAGVHAAPYDERRHLRGIMRLHDREPIRIVRSPEEYSQLLQLPKLHTWVLCRREAVSAYVVIGQAHNKNGVIEYGGQAADIAQLTMHVVRSQHFQRPLQMLFCASHLQLAEQFRTAGAKLEPLESSKGRGCEMIYVLGDRFAKAAQEDLFIWGPDST